MIVIIGQYRAAGDFAIKHGLTRRQWAAAYDRQSARAALMGRDPDNTIIEYVRGFEDVMTDEISALIAVLEAGRSS